MRLELAGWFSKVVGFCFFLSRENLTENAEVDGVDVIGATFEAGVISEKVHMSSSMHGSFCWRRCFLEKSILQVVSEEEEKLAVLTL